MKTLNYLLVTLLFSISCQSQNSISEVIEIKENPIPSIISIDENSQIEALKELSSDEFLGRGTGEAGGIIARDYIVKKFEGLGLDKLNGSYSQEFDFKGKDHHGDKVQIKAYNVLGKIKGSKYPNKYIVIGAHYDHLGKKGDKIYNGADDNASGTAALFTIASYLKKHLPEHSVIFAAWDAEELGLKGAKYFVDNSIVGKENILFNLNVDMIGRNDNNELYICGSRYHDNLVKELVPALKSDKIKISTGHDGADGKDDWTYASDHGPFHKAGIPFLYFGVEDHKDYHRDTDTFEGVQQDFYLEATRVSIQALLFADKMYK